MEAEGSGGGGKDALRSPKDALSSSKVRSKVAPVGVCPKRLTHALHARIKGNRGIIEYLIDDEVEIR